MRVLYQSGNRLFFVADDDLGETTEGFLVDLRKEKSSTALLGSLLNHSPYYDWKRPSADSKTLSRVLQIASGRAPFTTTG